HTLFGIETTLAYRFEHKLAEPALRACIDGPGGTVRIKRSGDLSRGIAPDLVSKPLTIGALLNNDPTAFGDGRDVRVIVVELSLTANFKQTFLFTVLLYPGCLVLRFVAALL